jgi:hypothetical protein
MIKSTVLAIIILLAGVMAGWAISRQALPIIPYSAPVISPGTDWPAGCYLRFGDEYRFYVLAQPAE